MTTRRVWDPTLRALHGALAAAFGLGWATTEWVRRLAPGGRLCGAAIVVARMAWGFAGPRYARFAQFVRGPRATLGYALRVLAGREPRHLGHNPLGAWMVLALFACIAALALTGWLYTSDRFWGDETVESVHVALAWATLALVALHVAGVALASVRHRENLIAAMFTGRKQDAAEGDAA
ncbi:MAG: cytochrome b/b6 domain-containing protein [Caldimonas sp.]